MKVTEQELESITSLVMTLNEDEAQEAFVMTTLHIEVRDMEDAAVLGYVLMDESGIYNYHPQED